MKVLVLSCFYGVSLCVPGGQRVEPGVQVGAADAHGRAARHARLQQAVAYLGADDLGRHPGKGLGLGHAQQGAVFDGHVGLFLRSGRSALGFKCLLRFRHSSGYASRGFNGVAAPAHPAGSLRPRSAGRKSFRESDRRRESPPSSGRGCQARRWPFTTMF